MPPAKGQTEDENFQQLDQQKKNLQQRMNIKHDFMSKFFASGGEIPEWKTGLKESELMQGFISKHDRENIQSGTES